MADIREDIEYELRTAMLLNAVYGRATLNKIEEKLLKDKTDKLLATIYSSLEKELPEEMEDPFGEQYNIGYNQALRDVKDKLRRVLK